MQIGFIDRCQQQDGDFDRPHLRREIHPLRTARHRNQRCGKVGNARVRHGETGSDDRGEELLPLLDFARRQIEIQSGMVALESGEQQSEQFVAVRALHVAENVVCRQEIVEMLLGLGHEFLPPGRLALQCVYHIGRE